MSNAQLQRIQDLAAKFGCAVRVCDSRQWRVTHNGNTVCTVDPTDCRKKDIWTKKKLRREYASFGGLVDGIEAALRTYAAHVRDSAKEYATAKQELAATVDESFSVREDAITRSELELVGDELRIIIGTTHSTQVVQLSKERTRQFLEQSLECYREIYAREHASRGPF